MSELISIVIPAYNEQERIENSIVKVLKFIESDKNHKYELIVVNDGSKDSTVEILSKHKNVILESYTKNRGKGYATKIGIQRANGDYILMSDADLSTPLEELNKLLVQINNYDLVIGSRKLKESQVDQPFYRKIMGDVLNSIVKILLIKGINDTQCGFKLFKKVPAKTLFAMQKVEGFAFDIEILYLSKKLGYKIKEVPVRWESQGKSRINPLRDSYRVMRDLIRVKIYDLQKKYD